MPEPINNVPLGKVGRTVQAFIADDDVEVLKVRRHGDGTFTITPKETCMPDPIKNVPPNKVGNTVQAFINNDDVKRLDVTLQPDGTFTITPLE